MRRRNGKFEIKNGITQKLRENTYRKKEVTEKRSVKWKHFYMITDNEDNFVDHVICKHCDAIFTNGRGIGTTACLRHLNRCHKELDVRQYSSTRGTPTNKTITKQDVSSPVAKPTSIVTTTIRPAKKFKAIFPKIKARDKAELPGIIDDVMHECIKLCTQVVRPFDLFEGDYMREFAQGLLDIGEKYGKQVCAKDIIPTVPALSRAVKDKATDTLNSSVSKLKELLGEKQQFAITTKGWIDANEKNLLCIYCHYICEKWTMRKIALGCIECDVNENQINSKVYEFLSSLGFIDADIMYSFTLVTGSGSFSDNARMNVQMCFKRVLKNILSYTFYDSIDLESPKKHDSHGTHSGKLNDLTEKCNMILEKLRTMQDQGVLSLNLKSWSNKYSIIMNIGKEEERIKDIFKDVGELKLLESINFKEIRAVSTFLEPFQTIMDALKRENHCSQHGLSLFKMKLHNHLTVTRSDLHIVKVLKNRAEMAMNTNFSCSITQHIATFLCPKFKSLQFLTQSERIRTYDVIKSRIVKVVEITSMEQTEVDDAPDNFILDFDEFSDQNVISVDAGNELERYLCSKEGYESDPHHIGGFDVLKYWKSKSYVYPGLAELAKSILCIPACVMGEDNVFSAQPREERSVRLKAEDLSAVLVMNAEITQNQITIP